MHNLKIPPASSKNFPSRKKTHCGLHACVKKQSPVRFSRKIAQALSSTCPNKEFSDMQENRWCTPCVPHIVWTSSKVHLPQATIFHREDKGQCTKCAEDHLNKLKIPICLSSEKCSDDQIFFPAAVHWLWRGLACHVSHFTDLDPAGRNTQAKRESWSRRSRKAISISIFLELSQQRYIYIYSYIDI